jgi:type IV secretory pathway component VirB8
MFEIDHDEIKKKVEDGSYFEEAKAWYAQIFLSPIIERPWFILITTLALFIGFYALSGLGGLLPLKPGVPFAVISKDIVREQPKLTYIMQPGDDPFQTVAAAMASNFVKAWETFRFLGLRTRQLTVYQHSDSDVYAQYQQLMSYRNPDSPIAKYQMLSRDYWREVQVLNVTLRYNEEEKDEEKAEIPIGADVEFLVDEWQQGLIDRKNYTARVTFYYEPIKVKSIVNDLGVTIEVDIGETVVFEVQGYDVSETREEDE